MNPVKLYGVPNTYAALFKLNSEMYLEKLSIHIDSHPVYSLYKTKCIFDPRQFPILSIETDCENAELEWLT